MITLPTRLTRTLRPIVPFLLLGSLALTARAQDADLIACMAKYKTVDSMTATVVRTQHDDLMEEDEKTTGTLYYKSPGRVCLSFYDGDDRLILDGNTFALCGGGESITASGKTLELVEGMLTVMKVLVFDLAPGTDLSSIAETSLDKQGTRAVLTITPIVAGGERERRRMLFTSLVLTFDLKAGEIRSMRMNEQGENYTLYELSAYKPGTPVGEEVFDTVN